MEAITRSCVLVSGSGGLAQFVSADGELLREVQIPPGTSRAAPILDMLPPGAHLEISDGVEVVPPRSLIGVQKAEGRYRSGANPDWQPTSADRMQRELRELLNWKRQQQATVRKAKRLKALEAVDVIEDAPQPAAAAAVEPDPSQIADGDGAK